MPTVLTGKRQVNGKIPRKNVFRLYVGGIWEALHIFEGNDSIKILWGKTCYCMINPNNTLSGRYFKF